MEEYEIIESIGGGSFADVFKAKEKTTQEIVAIKILKKKYKKWEDCLELRECKSLQKLLDDSLSNERGMNNIIKLKRIIFIKKTGSFNLVFEYMKQDLLELMKSKEPDHLDESKIKDIIYQTLLGLTHMHKYGFFHRDMKPENLLINDTMVKIADFGLAREIRSIPPYTEYVSTRYYRAPECILKSTNYNSPMDIWAVGCIMAEIYNHPHPLFYGQNEKEVLNKICSILGTPNHDVWPEGLQQANLVGIKFPNNAGTDLAKIVPTASPKAIDLMKQMLQWDPNRRPTAANLLNHPFFANDNENNMTNLNIDISRFFENFEKNNNNLTRNDKNRDNEFIKKSISLLKQSRGDDNNYLKLLNDTDGLVKLLSQLKKEKIQDEKDYEKELNKFGINDFDVSNINGNNGLDITNLSINKSNNLFNQSLKLNNNNNIFNSNNKSNNNIVDIDFSYNVTTIGNNTSLKNSGIKLDNNNEKEDKEDKEDKDFNININTSINNDNDINNDINNEINDNNDNENENNNINNNNNGINIDNNNDNDNDIIINSNDGCGGNGGCFNFEVKIKKDSISNRIRSARKFLEENETKFNCDKNKILGGANGFCSAPPYKKDLLNGSGGNLNNNNLNNINGNCNNNNDLIYKYNSNSNSNLNSNTNININSNSNMDNQQPGPGNNIVNLNLGDPNNNNNYLNFGQNNTDSEFNKIFEKTRKKMGIVESDFIKKDFNFINNNSKGFQFFNDKETLFIGSRRNHLNNNNNNIWGIK